MGKGTISILEQKIGVWKSYQICWELSPSAVTKKGYVIMLRNDTCEISSPPRRFIDFVKMSQNTLFPLNIKNVQSCYLAEMKIPSWLWHFWYGHLNFDGLKILQRKSMVTGHYEIVVPSQVCEECVVGKQRRFSFLIVSHGDPRRY